MKRLRLVPRRIRRRRKKDAVIKACADFTTRIGFFGDNTFAAVVAVSYAIGAESLMKQNFQHPLNMSEIFMRWVLGGVVAMYIIDDWYSSRKACIGAPLCRPIGPLVRAVFTLDILLAVLSYPLLSLAFEAQWKLWILLMIHSVIGAVWAHCNWRLWTRQLDVSSRLFRTLFLQISSSAAISWALTMVFIVYCFMTLQFGWNRAEKGDEMHDQGLVACLLLTSMMVINRLLLPHALRAGWSSYEGELDG